MKNLHSLDQYRLKAEEIERYGANTDGDLGAGNGLFKVFVNGRSFFVIASDGGGWDHVSVSHRNRIPSWEEMCAIKDMFFAKEECVVEYHPPENQYVNIAKNCLHLWRPQNQSIPMPPMAFV